MKWIKENKRLVVICGAIISLIFLIIISVCLQESKEQQESDKINFRISDEYEYFDVSVDDFYKKISYELKDEGIITEKVETLEDDESLYDFNYGINLNNGDKILLSSSDEGETIDIIGYDFTENKEGKMAGIFIGKISKLFIKNFDKDDFLEKVGHEFLEAPETFESPETRYIYNHILYGIDIDYSTYNEEEVDQILAIFYPTEKTKEEIEEITAAKTEKKQETPQEEKRDDQSNAAAGTNSNTTDRGRNYSSSKSSTSNNQSTTSNTSSSQTNAVNRAKSYLKVSGFSHDGLVSQLEYEKFSHADAVYGADNCGANWNEQALKKAKSYLTSSAFSYQGLIDQLKYEKFTNEQATYGVNNCGANWNEQAAKKAKQYLSISSFSRDGLINQLLYEKYTYNQAVYGVNANGL